MHMFIALFSFKLVPYKSPYTHLYLLNHCANLYTVTMVLWGKFHNCNECYGQYTSVLNNKTKQNTRYRDVIMSAVVSQITTRDCLFNRLFRRRPKKFNSVTGLCQGNSPMTGEFPAQRAINAENVLMTSSWTTGIPYETDCTVTQLATELQQHMADELN